MAAQVNPAFLIPWVRAELAEDLSLCDALCARAQGDGLTEEEAELDVAGQLAERRGLLDSLERAAGELSLSEVREARGATEKLERSGGASCVAWLRATPGAAARSATALPGSLVSARASCARRAAAPGVARSQGQR